MWNKDGKIWYSEQEYKELEEKIQDYEYKYELASNQNAELHLHYQAALEQIEELKKELQND